MTKAEYNLIKFRIDSLLVLIVTKERALQRKQDQAIKAGTNKFDSYLDETQDISMMIEEKARLEKSIEGYESDLAVKAFAESVKNRSGAVVVNLAGIL